MFRRLQKRSRGQVTVEAAVLFGTVVAGFIALAIYLQRAVQGGVKSNADSFGSQFSSNNQWNVRTDSNTFETATTITSNQSTNYSTDLK